MPKRANPSADSAARSKPTKGPRTVHPYKIAEALRDNKPQSWNTFRTVVGGQGLSTTQRSKAWEIFKGSKNYTPAEFDLFRAEIESIDTKKDTGAGSGAGPDAAAKGEGKGKGKGKVQNKVLVETESDNRGRFGSGNG